MKVGELLIKAYNVLKKENIDTYMLDSQLLLQKVLDKDKLFIMLNRNFEVTKQQEEEYLKLIQCRRNKMPVKYILGECEFMGMNFNVRQGVLIPRPDTEILVEEVLKETKKSEYIQICDLCCGSGAIGISIASFIDIARIYAYDISESALSVTVENIDKFSLSDRVKVEKSDLLEKAISKKIKFDVIVSNPPYICEKIIPTLMDDVKNYEPYIALCGGEDGLDFYRRITKQSLLVLNEGGLLAFEIGYDQSEEVKNILKNNGFKEVKCIKDLSGLDRVVTGII
ncbi:peptide chain release factor N(5)-glutamine methyltransferase [Clostridium aestuarii]|uniref:Release factor glutamine methyltransferase n=1 Tax=Clostridium aestuarii TaxID=338193 RepID=A0ABT4D2Z4_9CLOT|nr:peptide chain release factor N(5)-glutamine methyltransferase [Clostridium aestuarii]MCY6485610.1 peptide chain release factor N(5)-glutamine methyltransferase [Clostridium aestuarii]